jgi:hypothetical protein
VGSKDHLIVGSSIMVCKKSDFRLFVPSWMRPAHKLQVISYIIIAALADAYPTAKHFNRAAANLQVIFIYVIEMVSALAISLLLVMSH